PHDLGPSLISGLDWIAFNIERAIGLRPATTGETDLAETLVPGLLTGIPRQLGAAMRLGELLLPDDGSTSSSGSGTPPEP
ncbi:MAG: hypothetical protein LBV34_00645, partial [Nocardiopsaceae bacterium]|nr:hypothetical protein [Nocardiopsaceae bacterium]